MNKYYMMAINLNDARAMNKLGKYTTVDAADKKVIEVQKQYMDGAITNGERSNKVSRCGRR